MEFTGRIKKVLPLRSGTSQRTGNEWKALPFIFEYFENPTDRFADTVMLETFDENVINNMKEGMEVRCGFSHKVRTYQKDGNDITINDIRLYKIECVKAAQAAQQAPQGANASLAGNQPTPPFPEPQNPSNQADDDDLPF